MSTTRYDECQSYIGRCPIPAVSLHPHPQHGRTDGRTDGNIVHNEHSFEGDRLSATSRAAGQWRRGSGEAEIDAFR